MRSTFKILFYANKGKEKDGIVPIMGRIPINGTQCHRNMQNRLFLFPHRVYSIPTIPSMTQPRKNSERNAKEEKEARAKIVNAYQLVLHVSYWGTLFNAPLLKIAIKHLETFVFAFNSLNLHTECLILYKTTQNNGQSAL